MLEDLLRHAAFDDAAVLHDDRSVGEITNDRKIVRDEQVGQTEPVAQIFEKVDDLRLDRDIQRRNGFVTYDDLGLERQRAGNGDALPLTTGKLVRIAIRMFWLQAHLFEKLLNAPAPLRAG